MNERASQRGAAVGLTVLLAILAGTLLRAEYLRELLLSPFGRHLVLDAEWFDQAAQAIASGRELASGDLLFRPPLYPTLLAAVYKIVGHELLVPRLVQSLLGIGTVLLVVRIARITHGENAARLTAVLAATYGMFIYFEGEILTSTRGVFLIASATVLLLEGLARASVPRLALAGFTGGLAALTHGTLLVFAPVAAFSALRRPGSRLALTAAFLAGLALPLGAAGARNWAASREFVVLGSQGGVNFYIGNNPASDGKSALAPGFAEASQVLGSPGVYRDTMEVASRSLAEREMGRRLTASEISDFWFRKGFDWIRSHPKEATLLYVRKLIYFWNGHEISNNRDLHDQARRQTPILRFFLLQFSILLPFALYGALREGLAAPERRTLAAAFVVLGVFTAAFFVCSRFRLPSVVWVLPFAAAGMLAFVRDVRAAGTVPSRLARAIAPLAAFLVAVNPIAVTASGIAPVTVERDAPFHRFNLAVLYEREGNDERAIAEYRAASGSGVADPRVHLNLGNALTRTGRFEEARREYRTVLELAPDYAGAVHNNFGILAAHDGDWDAAIEEFEASLEADPANGSALSNLASAYLSSGRYDEAIVTFRRALLRPDANEAILRRSLGMAYYESGLLEDAEDELVAALRLDPRDLLSILTMAKVCIEQGRPSEAETWWSTARQFASNAPAVERAIRDYQDARSRREGR